MQHFEQTLLVINTRCRKQLQRFVVLVPGACGVWPLHVVLRNQLLRLAKQRGIHLGIFWQVVLWEEIVKRGRMVMWRKNVCGGKWISAYHNCDQLGDDLLQTRFAVRNHHITLLQNFLLLSDI